MTEYSARYLVLLTVLLMLVSIVNIADKELLSPVADIVRSELGMTDTQLGAVRSAAFLAALLSQLYWGPLSDLWVRKYVITLGTVVWSGLTWLTAFVGNFPQLVAARGAMSFAEGCFNPSSFALITDSTPRRRHGLLLGLLSLTYPVGTAAALIVVSIIGTAHWRQPFIIFGIQGIGLGALVLLVVREPKRGAEGVGSGYAGGFSWEEMRRVWGTQSVRLGFALDTCQATVNYTLAFWAPTYFTRYRIAPNADAAALALLPAVLGFVLGAVIGGIAIDRLSRESERAPVWVALAAMSGGLVAAFAVFNLYDLTQVMAAGFVLGLISFMALPAVNVIFFRVIPPETKATTIATSNVILNLVIAVLTFLIGVISDASGLRLAFGGVVLGMFALGIGVCIALLSVFSRDMERQDARMKSPSVPNSRGDSPNEK